MAKQLLTATNWQLVKVSGSQAEAFLQGHLTADIKRDTKQAILAAACDSKGRVLASMYVFRVEEANENYFYLFLPIDAWDGLTEFWQKYLALYRQATMQVMEGVCYLGEDGDALLSLAFDDTRQLILVDKEIADTTDSQTLDSYLIEQRVPHIYKATAGLWIPQVLGYEQLGALSYTKGCYVGQEVVARVHYLGKSKRACCQLEFSLSRQPEIGMPLENAKNKAIGNLVNFYHQGEQSYRALAVLNIQAIEDRDILLQDGEGTAKAHLLDANEAKE